MLEKIVENNELLTEFAKVIYKDVEKYVSEHIKEIEDKEMM